MKTNASRKRRGATLVEVVTASAMSILVLTGTVMTLFIGTTSWIRGQSRIEAETDAQSAVRFVSQELREAMSVTVDTNGRGLNYRRAVTDAEGNYTIPIVWDGVDRRIELQGDDLVVTGGGTRTIARGIILTDPETVGGLGTYRIFTAGPGTITRQVTVQIVTERLGHRNELITSRNRETIFLRNIPELTK